MEEHCEHATDLKIFIWHASIEHLQYFTWLALQSLVRTPLTFVLGHWESEVRKAQGWKMLDLRGLNPILLPPQNLQKEGIRLLRENSEAIHVFWAFRGVEGYNFLPLILFALRKGIKVAVVDEAYSTSAFGYFYDENPLLARIKTWVRPILRHAIARLLYAVAPSNKPCIMSLSLIAQEQFIRLGFAPDTLFPFGYFVPRQNVTARSRSASTAVRLVFVGAMISRKGLDVLMQAVRNLQQQGYRITVDIFGSGNAELAGSSGLPINYNGILPFDQIQAAIAEHDILVLPSRHDGWGVVVNEALMQGVPVIASSRVGAKCLLESTSAGLVFESENANDLSEKIKMLIENPLLLKDLQTKARKAGEEILPEKGAQYFLDALLHYFYQLGPRPSAIWSGTEIEAHI